MSKEKIFSWSNGVQSGAVTPTKPTRKEKKDNLHQKACEKCGVLYYSASGNSTACMTCRWLTDTGDPAANAVPKIMPNSTCEDCGTGYYSASGRSTLCLGCRQNISANGVDVPCTICKQSFKIAKGTWRWNHR
jgi:hypothetical protein